MINFYDVLGENFRKKSFVLLVENILYKCQDIESKFERKEKEVDNMSNENYELTMFKKKLFYEM